MWALVFVCEALCHESSMLLITSGLEVHRGLKARAAAQVQWATGRLEYINKRNGIRQAAVFAEHFRERWSVLTQPSNAFDLDCRPTMSRSPTTISLDTFYTASSEKPGSSEPERFWEVSTEA